MKRTSLLLTFLLLLSAPAIAEDEPETTSPQLEELTAEDQEIIEMLELLEILELLDNMDDVAALEDDQ